MGLRIAAIPGSLRAGSYSRALLVTAGESVTPEVRVTVWDRLKAVAPFKEDLEAGPPPAGVAQLRQAITGADGVLMVTPEYNGSIPGQLKNALDWASRPRGSAVLEGKPPAAIGVSPSPRGAAWALADLRKVLTVIEVDLIKTDLVVPHVHTQLTLDGRIADRSWLRTSPISSASWSGTSQRSASRWRPFRGGATDEVSHHRSTSARSLRAAHSQTSLSRATPATGSRGRAGCERWCH